MTTAGRHRRTEARPDPLFGSGLRLDPQYRGYEWRHLKVGFLDIVRQLPRLVAVILRVAWRADRRAVAVILICEPLSGVASAVSLLAAGRVLAHLLAGPPDRQRFLAAGSAIALASGSMAVISVLRALSQAESGRLGPRVERYTYTALLERAIRVDMSIVEDPDFHNSMSAARRGSMAARDVTERLTGLLRGLVALVSAAGALGVLHPLLLVLLPASLLPRFWAAVKSARARYTSVRTWIEVNRQVELLAQLIIDRDTAEEIRVHDVGPFLLGHYGRLARLAEDEHARLARATAGTNLVADALAGAAAVATYGLLGALVLAGTVPVAVAGAAVLALRTVTSRLLEIVVSFNELYEKGLYLLDWQQACERCDEAAMGGGDATPPAWPSLVSAHGVVFRYPGASRPALAGVDVYVRSGEVIAFVGENGSGKTTLARLLTGLYQPDDGVVRWDGRPVPEIRRTTLFDRVSLVSQNYVQWPFTAALNVTVGRPDSVDPVRLAAAARASGADEVVDGLRNGWDTLLAREFLGGVSLSGGQWQRLALARSMYRGAPVVVLDEPTASLDPAAEVETFEQVTRLAAEGHCVILITHRLASVRHADRIYLLAGGVVVEQGSHAELMAAAGRYASMYRLQAAQYEYEPQPL